MRQRPIDLAEETIHERGEEFYLYGEEQKAKPARIKLAELGWARKSDVTDGDVIVPTGLRPRTAGMWIETPWHATLPPSRLVASKS